jgi:hypothetical protein
MWKPPGGLASWVVAPECQVERYLPASDSMMSNAATLGLIGSLATLVQVGSPRKSQPWQVNSQPGSNALVITKTGQPQFSGLHPKSRHPEASSARGPEKSNFSAELSLRGRRFILGESAAGTGPFISQNRPHVNLLPCSSPQEKRAKTSTQANA